MDIEIENPDIALADIYYSDDHDQYRDNNPELGIMLMAVFVNAGNLIAEIERCGVFDPNTLHEQHTAVVVAMSPENYRSHCSCGWMSNQRFTWKQDANSAGKNHKREQQLRFMRLATQWNESKLRARTLLSEILSADA